MKFLAALSNLLEILSSSGALDAFTFLHTLTNSALVIFLNSKTLIDNVRGLDLMVAYYLGIFCKLWSIFTQIKFICNITITCYLIVVNSKVIYCSGL